jgi:hypothetical protein
MYVNETPVLVQDGWSMYDVIIIAFSLMSLASDEIPGVKVLRLMRAFRKCLSVRLSIDVSLCLATEGLKHCLSVGLSVVPWHSEDN